MQQEKENQDVESPSIPAEAPSSSSMIEDLNGPLARIKELEQALAYAWLVML